MTHMNWKGLVQNHGKNSLGGGRSWLYSWWEGQLAGRRAGAVFQGISLSPPRRLHCPVVFGTFPEKHKIQARNLK